MRPLLPMAIGLLLCLLPAATAGTSLWSADVRGQVSIALPETLPDPDVPTVPRPGPVTPPHPSLPDPALPRPTPIPQPPMPPMPPAPPLPEETVHRALVIVGGLARCLYDLPFNPVPFALCPGEAIGRA